MSAIFTPNRCPPRPRFRRLIFEQMESRAMLTDVPWLVIDPSEPEGSDEPLPIGSEGFAPETLPIDGAFQEIDLWVDESFQLANPVRERQDALDELFRWHGLGSGIAADSSAGNLTLNSDFSEPRDNAGFRISVTPASLDAVLTLPNFRSLPTDSARDFLDVGVAVNLPLQRANESWIDLSRSTPRLASPGPVHAAQRLSERLGPLDEGPRHLRRAPQWVTALEGNRDEARAFELGSVSEERAEPLASPNSSLSELPTRVVRRDPGMRTWTKPAPAPVIRVATAPNDTKLPPVPPPVPEGPSAARFAVPTRPSAEPSAAPGPTALRRMERSPVAPAEARRVTAPPDNSQRPGLTARATAPALLANRAVDVNP